MVKYFLSFLSFAFLMVSPVFGQETNISVSTSSSQTENSIVEPASSRAYSSVSKPKLTQQELLLRRIKSNPKDTKAYDDLMAYYLRTGQRRARIRITMKAIQSLGGRLKWYENLGDDYKAIGDYEKSLAVFQVALQIVPTSSSIYNRTGLVLLKLARFHQAEVAFKASLYFGGTKKSWNNLGVAYEARNDLKQAYICFKKALSFYPNYPNALENMKRVGKLIQEQNQQ